ncbi:RNA polymerase sigma70 [Stenotrophomonas daejeonensis]|uniref:RNA polymerase sigma factor n=1 Tax=Stenotrophomonas daejeonensis TaxID=659018 RepID=A0A0R0EC98_9GAMM|nr:sigma-70 family RNA polymerase sigma factor [Stenotrophomonas daejeonensis]KRG87944.1 RNA polymerase sigma70 [Stenotrophomonas daejeonensis]
MTATTLESMLHRELPAARGGCTQSYGRIVVACQNTVTAIALAITRDVQASEDIAQEAFIKAWQQLNQLNNAASFLPWLRQITRNLARDWLRANRNRPLSGEAAEIAIGMAADPAPGAAEAMARVEEELAAEEIISTLPEDSRETLLLFYREGQSSQQVAALLGLSDAAVRKRLSRARATVREEMLKRFGEFARGSAPSAAFALVVVGALVGATPVASAATVIGSGVLGGGLGKLGTGGITGGIAGGSLGAIVQHLTDHPAVLLGMLGGVLGGVVGYGLTWWYLVRFCAGARERAQVQRFMLLNMTTGTTMLFCIMLAVVLTPGWQATLATFAIGISIVNYQYLVTLPRIMDPILARADNARRRRGYAWVIGKPAVVASTLVAGTCLLHALHNAGRL